MFRVSESAVISVGNGLEQLVGKFALILLVIWVVSALLGYPEWGSLQPNKVNKPLGTSGGTRQEWHTAVASLAG